VPDALIAAMRASPCVRVELPIAERVKLLRDEYVHFERDPEQLLAQLNCLVALHGRERVEQWKTLVAAGQWDQLVERLLLEHYDPAYLRSINRNFAHSAAAHVVTLARSAPDAYASAAQALAAARSS
jgi:tRNA 2-selenouridine synthase